MKGPALLFVYNNYYCNHSQWIDLVICAYIFVCEVPFKFSFPYYITSFESSIIITSSHTFIHDNNC